MATNKERVTKKKSRLLNGSLDFTGTEALRADMKLSGLSAANINAYILNINQPTAPGVTVRVADGISCNRSAAATITEPRQIISPLSLVEQPMHCITVYEKVATICIGGF